MADPPRPDLLATLTRAGHLDPARADALLDANPAERAIACRVLLDQAAEVLTDADIIRPTRSVLDLRLREVEALAAVLGRLASWWPQPGLDRLRLGDVLKVVDPGDAAFVVDLLVWGGWLQQEGGT